MNVIIACAGNSSRFDTKEPKHISKINGIPCILRTVQLLKQFGVDDISITVSTNNKEYFDSFDCNIIVGSNTREIDRYRNIYNYITEKTIVLYGDVVYHQNDIKNILEIQSINNVFFGRLHPNSLTKKPYGELFGVIINNKDYFIHCTDTVADLFDRKIIDREIGWEVFRQSENQNVRVNNNKKTDNFYEVSDYTDDFDTMAEYIILREIYKNIKE